MLLPGIDRGNAVNKGTVAIILALMAPGDAMAEPKVLADWELDSITAAGVLVDVSSIAAALGDFAKAKTDADTFAFDGKTLDLGVGITMGQALACCGEEADVEVGSAVLGIGDIVHGFTHRVEHDGRSLAHGLSVGFVLAMSFENHSATVRDAHLAMLKELRAALADFHFELPDAAMVGAQ
jgi:hypothetical protein